MKLLVILFIIKVLEEIDLLIKGVSKTIKNEVEKQKDRFFRVLLGTLDASLWGNLLTGESTIRAGEGTIRAGQNH